jgi:hypothetical protein
MSEPDFARTIETTPLFPEPVANSGRTVIMVPAKPELLVPVRQTVPISCGAPRRLTASPVKRRDDPPSAHPPRPSRGSLALPVSVFVTLLTASAVFSLLTFLGSTAAAQRRLSAVVLTANDPRVLETSQALRRETGEREALSRRRASLDASLRNAASYVDLERASHDLAGVDALLAQNERVITSLSRSPYGVAKDGDIVVGLAPGQAGSVEPGTPIYACKTEFLFCREVGKVGDRLEGVASRESSRSALQTARGHLVRLHLSEVAAAEQRILYAGAPPLL